MSETTSSRLHNGRSPIHVWERWDWVWHVLAYSLMLLHLVLAWGNEARSGSLTAVLMLAALLAIWYAPFIPLSDTFWTARLPLSLLYFLAGWTLWAWLITLHPAALMLAGFFYPLLFVRLPLRWAIGSAALLTVIIFIASSGALVGQSALLLSSLPLFVGAVVVGLFIHALIEQSQTRQQLLDELTQTQASLARLEREAGVWSERQRLAREIHDTLAQDFTSIIMHLSAAQLQFGMDDRAVRQAIVQAETTARDGLNEARRLVWALQPSQLAEVSLLDGLRGLVEEWETAFDTTAVFTLTGEPKPLRPALETTLFRAVQETLRNVEKHAQAGQVNLTLSFMPDQIVLDVVDDGRGFTPAAGPTADPATGGFGLRGMQERVARLGGRLTIESHPGEGTAVAISLPVDEGRII